MKKVMLICGLTLTLASCATIFGKSEYPVAISSTPDLADVIIVNRSGQEIFNGKTPATVKLKSSAGYFKPESYQVTFKKEGYPDKTYLLQGSINGWYFGNIALGGLIGMLIVDPSTGAMYKLPDEVKITLTQPSTSLDNSLGKIKITTIDQVAESTRAQLVRIR